MSSFTPDQQGELDLLLRQREDSGLIAQKIRDLQGRVLAGGGGVGPAGPPGPTGPAGPTGPPGPGSVQVHYNQGTPALTWGPINHGLGKYPPVTIITSAGDEVVGAVHYVDANNVTLLFDAAFQGDAYFT